MKRFAPAFAAAATVLAAVTLGVIGLAGIAGAHNDTSIVTVISLAPGAPGTVVAVVSVVYSEDLHPVDDAVVHAVQTDSGSAPTPMPFSGTPGTYSATVPVSGTAPFNLTFTADDPKGEVSAPFSPPPTDTSTSTSTSIAISTSTSNADSAAPSSGKSSTTDVSSSAAQSTGDVAPSLDADGGSVSGLVLAVAVLAGLAIIGGGIAVLRLRARR